MSQNHWKKVKEENSLRVQRSTLTYRLSVRPVAQRPTQGWIDSHNDGFVRAVKQYFLTTTCESPFCERLEEARNKRIKDLVGKLTGWKWLAGSLAEQGPKQPSLNGV